MQNQQRCERIPDTFICHANEDKASIARPLRDALKKMGINAWLDESEVQIGDSIRNKIDEGLSNCRSATVILSRIFFEKYWTQYEIEGIFQRQVRREILLLPIRHGITIEEIRNHSPSLAGIASLNSSEETVEQIARKIAERISKLSPPIAAPPKTPETKPEIRRSFGTFYVAPARTPEPHGHSEPEKITTLPNQDASKWAPMVDNKEELYYKLKRDRLRIRIDLDNIQGNTIIHKGEPIAITIRHSHAKQIYLPSVVKVSNHAQKYLDPHWTTFLIGHPKG